MHQRERNIKNCKLYYERHAHEVLKRKALRGVTKGAVPRAKTCTELKISVVELMLAWQTYTASNPVTLEERSAKFQDLLSRYALSNC